MSATLGETPITLAQAARRGAWALYLIVLVSGAVLMGVEIAGAKIMAPGFGTSIFVWGSIIGLFMAALASGYYLGGMLADRKPAFAFLAAIVSAAGVLTVLIPRFGPGMCESIARHDLGPVFGPLFAAAAVFFLPSFLMGMVSPYAVKLNATSLTALGGVAGRLY
ncbi:MAG: fused MFS/spermidine synthase, partial [Planctomycetota bacterium]